MGSGFGRLFHVTTFGESHGGALGCVVENCPAGLELAEHDIQPDLDRRRPGQSNVTTPRKEADRVTILSGVFEGKTTGSPVAMAVHNENAKEKDYSHFKNVYRPSHADYTYQMRYGHRATRGGGRASARTTIGQVAAAAIAKKILKEKTGIEITAFVERVHNKAIDPEYWLKTATELRTLTDQNDIRCPDQQLAGAIYRDIQDTRQQGDSLGGVVGLRIDNVPAGLGDPVFDRLDALLAMVMLSIPAAKGFENGSGFQSAGMKGSEHNDIFFTEKQVGGSSLVKTRTNYSGGIQGGISNGMPVTARIAFKPTATISKPQKTVDIEQNETELNVKGRHDPCVLPRAVPIVEAMAALVLVDQYLLSRITKYEQL